MKKKWVVITLTLFILLANTYAKSPKIELQPALKTELNTLLKTTDDLHKACIDQDAKSVDEEIAQLIKIINSVEKKSAMANVQRTHLVKILNAAKNNLEMSQSLRGEKKRESLKNAFKDLVQMAQVFLLDRYKIFFCNKDKALWLQSKSKPQNPIHPKKFGRCGRLVK